MQSFKDRLIFLFDDCGQANIAKKIGMTYQGFKRIWHEGGIPKVETIVHIQEITGCDLNWLLVGQGEPFPSSINQPSDNQEASAAGSGAAMDTLKKRLIFLFGTDAGPTYISQAIGMKYPGFARVWYDGSTPKIDTMINIQKATGCNLNWLLTGKGTPLLPQAEHGASAAQAVAEQSSSEQSGSEQAAVGRAQVEPSAAGQAAKQSAQFELSMMKQMVEQATQAVMERWHEVVPPPAKAPYSAALSPAAPVSRHSLTPPSPTDAWGKPVDTSEFIYISSNDALAVAEPDVDVEKESAQEQGREPLTLAFRKFWIMNCLRANPRDLSVLAVTDDTMSDMLNIGDNVLVNHRKTKPGNGLYVMDIGGSLTVKQTQCMPDNKLLVKCANQSYDTFVMDLASPPDDVKIVGRVEWSGRQC